MLYCIDIPQRNESVPGLIHSSVWLRKVLLRKQVWLWHMLFRSHLHRNKSRIWQALACQWLNALCKMHKQAVWLLTCRKSPICSISSLKCSIFLLMVKLGSVEVYSWRPPLVKAWRINEKHSTEFQVTHSEIQILKTATLTILGQI